MIENKNSFFSLRINTEEIKNNKFAMEKLENSIDLILSSLNATKSVYKFNQKNNNEIICLFETGTRKRKGQLIKLCENLLEEKIFFVGDGITKFVFDNEIQRFTKNANFIMVEKPILFSEYRGNDIKVFNNKNNWYPWQKDVYNLIFNEDSTFREPDPRKIISLVDKEGNSGKSSFFKWLFFNHPETIGRIGYGSASQLRSSAVNMGKKKLYIVDLARSKSKNDKEEDLLSVLEDLKSGLVTNAMYGSGKTLLMEPPHIIVSSNYILKYELLSSDRWNVVEINKSNKLKLLKESRSKKVIKKF